MRGRLGCLGGVREKKNKKKRGYPQISQISQIEDVEDEDVIFLLDRSRFSWYYYFIKGNDGYTASSWRGPWATPPIVQRFSLISKVPTTSSVVAFVTCMPK